MATLLKKVGQFLESTEIAYDADVHSVTYFFTPNTLIMTSFTYVCGIDVSKDTLDLCKMAVEDNTNYAESRLKNRAGDIRAWLKTLDSASTLYVVESTGTYSATLLHYMSEYHLPVMVVSPRKSKAFMDALGLSNKNDRQASHALALMGKSLPVKLYQAPDERRQRHKQILGALNALKKQRRMLLNQLHALDRTPLIEEAARGAYEQVLQEVERQIKELTGRLGEFEKDEEFTQALKFAVSVKGIGQKTAQAILMAANCLVDFEFAGQLAKFFGIIPATHYSGSSVRKKGRITKIGPAYVRALLFNCTRSAIRYNPACKALFERLRRKGKPYKVAAVAVMHKLIKQVFACVKKRQMFDPEFHLNNN